VILETINQKLASKQKEKLNAIWSQSSPRLTAGGTVTAIPAAFRRGEVEISYQSANPAGIKTQGSRRNVVQKSDSTSYS